MHSGVIRDIHEGRLFNYVMAGKGCYDLEIADWKRGNSRMNA